MTPYSELILKIKSYYPTVNESLILKAFTFARSAHGSQKRHSGELYFSHPVAVAEITAELKLDQNSIVAALLHDVVEDTETTVEDIEKNFGIDIANLVDGVTKLGKIENITANEKFAENFRKLTIAMSKDIRVLLVKLADRLHNMQTLNFVPSKEKKLQKAKETIEIYAPLAERIGLNRIKDELQELSFAIIEPEIHKQITEKLSSINASENHLIAEIKQHLLELMAEANLSAEITGRSKKAYSVWQKIQKRNLEFSHLNDIMAFRLITEDLEGCYKALGVINSNYNMIPQSFKDYISTPKENGYQSLHLVIIGPLGKKIEIQIRNQEMHEFAELGIAAHWRYKDKNQKLTSQQKQKKILIENQQYRWIRELVSLFENSESANEALKQHKFNINLDQVFCFTPNGDVFNLPLGSTLIDFAYAIHSEVGDSCIGAKVNGLISPLKETIKNGDQIEIQTGKNAKPSLNWLSFVVSSKAKHHIKSFIKNQKFEEYKTLGKAILNKFFLSKNIEVNEKLLEKTLNQIRCKNIEELYFRIADGSIKRQEILNLTHPELALEQKKKEQVKQNQRIQRESIAISGLLRGMSVHYAGCCNPIPGDAIIGVINTGTGISIHQKQCNNLQRLAISSQRMVEINWKDAEQDDEIFYKAKIRIVIKNKPGGFIDISNIIANQRINIIQIATVNRTEDCIEMAIEVEINNRNELYKLMIALKTAKQALEVSRIFEN